MDTEKKLAQYVADTTYDELPAESIDVIRNVVLTIFGTTLAGATLEGCEAVVGQVRDWGGREEATVLVHGGKVPAHNAAFANSVMARAHDFCDAMSPGIHLGSSSVPTALAAAELAGGCTGKEFLAALVLGTELAARINSVSDYDGFDPTGVCAVFATTAVAGRLLRLDSREMLHALALAFSKAGGSLQANIDGTLAVRISQGWVSQSGVICAQLAKRGITGPKNFLDGTYGYFHLYTKGTRQAEALVAGLGETFALKNTIFKKHPSCGCTLASTDAILELTAEHDVPPEEIESVEVQVSPYAYKLTGHPFELGDNPKVNAQFSIQYCVANVILRRGSKLDHFDEPSVKDDRVLDLIRRIHVSADPSLPEPGKPDPTGATHLTARMKVTTKKGGLFYKSVDIPRGNPRNPLDPKEHMERFRGCVDYANARIPGFGIDGDRVLAGVVGLEKLEDVRVLIPLLLLPEGVRAF